MKKPWISFAIVFASSFAVLGWIGTRVYQEMPPIPAKIVDTTGAVGAARQAADLFLRGGGLLEYGGSGPVRLTLDPPIALYFMQGLNTTPLRNTPRCSECTACSASV